MTTIDEKARTLLDLRKMREELDAEIEALQDALKSEMINRGEETMTGNGWKASWKVIESSRLDSKKLKAEQPDIVARYTVTTRTSRFLISA